MQYPCNKYVRYGHYNHHLYQKFNFEDQFVHFRLLLWIKMSTIIYLQYLKMKNDYSEVQKNVTPALTKGINECQSGYQMRNHVAKKSHKALKQLPACLCLCLLQL